MPGLEIMAMGSLLSSSVEGELLLDTGELKKIPGKVMLQWYLLDQDEQVLRNYLGVDEDVSWYLTDEYMERWYGVFWKYRTLQEVAHALPETPSVKLQMAISTELVPKAEEIVRRITDDAMDSEEDSAEVLKCA